MLPSIVQKFVEDHNEQEQNSPMKTSAKFLLKFAAVMILPVFAFAHVKWFSRTVDTSTLTLSAFDRPAFWFLLGLTIVTLALIVYADRVLERWGAYRRFSSYLESYEDRAVLILRVFTGASLLLSWQADSMIAPELKITSAGPGWFQFVLALLLLTSTTTPLAGLGMIGLYAYAMIEYGYFHLLDYLAFAAIGYFLFIASFPKRKISQTRVPALYIGVGFSLCWAALEKVFFPGWGMDVLRQEPSLTMGLPADFFLLSTAFVELSLGYLLIIGLLQRPLALTITAVFFTTSAFFGKTEVIGHTILHGALLVFAVIGPGKYYPAPIEFHKQLLKRAAFAAVNFVVVIGVLSYCYYRMASHT